MIQFLLIIIFASLLVCLATQPHIINSKYSTRHDITRKQRASPEANHKCVIAIKFQNQELLLETLMKVSNPESPEYGQYLSRTEISSLISNPAATTAVVSYLRGQGFEDIEVSKYGEFITVQAPISKWEQTLSTEFHHFDRVDRKGVGMQPVMRALAMTMPSELVPHVHAIFNTVQMPLPSIYSEPQFTPQSVTTQDIGSLTPQLLKSFYSINKVGNGNGSQCVYATSEQNFSPDDLAQFQSKFSLPNQPVAQDYNGHNSSSVCRTSPGSCIEANLDVQYLMAVGVGVPTVYYYDNSGDFIVSWAKHLLDMQNPPLVNSISYGANEADLDSQTAELFDTTVIALAVMGVTMVAGSGDDGAPGKPVHLELFNCSYNPIWPTTSPYVLSVGATQGPESGGPEIACSSSTGGIITTGGGFSNLYGRPTFQDAVVSKYFTVTQGSLAPVAGYNKTGRAYPDLSVMGFNYEVIIGGNITLISGTSAATPVVAGMLALVNSARLAANRSALGWVNPTIYANYSMFANDITSGNNYCVSSSSYYSSGHCCTQGFNAAVGWDPLTGVGSVNFKGLFNLFFHLGYTYTPMPTESPTASPTPRPSRPPTVRPTFSPTVEPTAQPTDPTAMPTVVPTLAPTKGAAAPAKKSNTLIIAAIVIVAVIIGLACLCAYWYLTGDEADKKPEYEGVALTNLADEDNRHHHTADNHHHAFGSEHQSEDVMNAINQSLMDSKPQPSEAQLEADAIEAQNMEMLENMLYSAETNEYEEAHVSLFDHIQESDIKSSVQRLGIETVDLENFLFSADANEYGISASSVFGSVAAKAVIKHPEALNDDLESVMFSADTNEYSKTSLFDTPATVNPMLKFAKTAPPVKKAQVPLLQKLTGKALSGKSTSSKSGKEKTPKAAKTPKTPKIETSDEAGKSPKESQSSPRGSSKRFFWSSSSTDEVEQPVPASSPHVAVADVSPSSSNASSPRAFFGSSFLFGSSTATAAAVPTDSPSGSPRAQASPKAGLSPSSSPRSSPRADASMSVKEPRTLTYTTSVDSVASKSSKF